MTAYADKRAQLAASLAADGGTGFGLAKETSNLFRDRAPRERPRVDLSGFDRVIGVDPAAGTVDAEGMTTFVDLADATLAHGTMPAVVPQLKSITLGGAVAGVGIEASSFRHGLVHETVTAMDVLTGDGRIVTCTADNEHRDLFFGLPNSYGTLGYTLRLTARTLPVKPFVALDHRTFRDPQSFFAALAESLQDPGIDFLDGVVFAPDELVLSPARFVDEAPFASDYTYERIYYKSLRERASDYLATRDYLWRWDTDWFWCSKNLGAQNPVLRRIYGRGRLNSIFYQRVMRWNTRWKLGAAIERARGLRAESVIQDVDLPLARAAEFLRFLFAEVGVLPIWVCPIRAPEVAGRYPLYPLEPGTAYVNFGFWDRVTVREARPAGYINRKIERCVREMGGLKSLYSDSYFTQEEFWSIYSRPAYAALKAKYDAGNALPDLYAKCVLKR
ncbi:MAG TPA: FAD-binding oxidoreductase [Casimicrobiaceae bacterium]|nr:FAD-binding oxidoreductase [Casimicrobiaceae bacterium]